MKTIKSSEMERVFVKLQVVEKGANHHRSGFIVNNDGKKLFPPVYFSKGRKEIGPAIVDEIRKSLLLQRGEFEVLVSCRMSRDEYLSIRRDR